MMRGVVVLEAGHGVRRVVGELGRVNPAEPPVEPPAEPPAGTVVLQASWQLGDACDIFHKRSGSTRRLISHFRWIGGYSL